MGRGPTNENTNMYFQARKKAATYNERLWSREGAAELLGISVSTLADYELGNTKVVPVDKVVLMADLYNAPELITGYCMRECPVHGFLPLATEEKSLEGIALRLLQKIRRAYMDKYLSIITNFGCHGRCPYCIVRENGIKVPKSTIGGLDKLEDAIKMTGANIVSISGGGDPLYRYSDNPLVPMYLGMVMGICIKAGIPMEMHTSYTESEFPYHFCKRVVYHLQSVEDLENVVRRGAEIVRVVFVATEKLSREEINRISDFVRCSDQIDELSFRQMVNDRYETEYYNDDFLKAGHNKGLWHYIRQKDYNIYYAENRIYTKFSEIEADIQEER